MRRSARARRSGARRARQSCRSLAQRPGTSWRRSARPSSGRCGTPRACSATLGPPGPRRSPIDWLPGTAARRRRSLPWGGNSTSTPRSARASTTCRPRLPGLPATSWPCPSTTSSPAGCGSRRSDRTAARPSSRGLPRSSARSWAGTRPARHARWRRTWRWRGASTGCRGRAADVAEPLILALDQGTTSSRAIAFGRDGRRVASAQKPFPQQFPSPGHVTHDPEQIWSSQLAVARDVIGAVGGAERIAAIGITNQRETTIVWDRATGEPIADAIVWQSRITPPACEALRAAGHEALFRHRTGLPLDAYFSGPKIAHILDSVPGARARAERGELAFGTVDSFLLWRLAGGTAAAGAVHATDVSNASRTLLFDIHRLAWDDELLDLVGVPSEVLPDVRPTSGVFGESAPDLFGRSIPIAALAGDQQAATFGQACFEPGRA